MKLASLLILIAAVSVSQASGTEWAFPENGPSSSGENLLGKAGKFYKFHTVTDHSPEEVFLWYAKKMELGENHALVKKAKAGFHSLDKLNMVSYSVVRDTDTEKSGALISAMLSPEIAHIQIFIRPENDSENDLTISIARTPKGTAIAVIESVPGANNKVTKSK